MRISDWSSDVCSSDLRPLLVLEPVRADGQQPRSPDEELEEVHHDQSQLQAHPASPLGADRNGRRSLAAQVTGKPWASEARGCLAALRRRARPPGCGRRAWPAAGGGRSEENTSEIQSLMRISYAVFC